MTGKVRGAQLLSKIYRSRQLASDCASHVSAGHCRQESVWQQSRAFAAQPARDLASDSAYEAAPEQLNRVSQHQAHQYLFNTLQGALAEAHSTTVSNDCQDKQKFAADYILQQFAPIDLMLRAANDDLSQEKLRMLDKWRQQLKQEWNSVRELRESYTQRAKDMKKLGRGAVLKSSKSMMQKWFPALRDAIEAEQLAVSNAV